MTIETNAPLPDALRSCEVHSADGQSTPIGDIVRGQPTLLLFVRHFGCIGCSENIGLIAPRFRELSALGVRVAIIGCGTPNFIDGFIERHHLVGEPCEVYSDPSLSAHNHAALRYGHWGGLGPRAWAEMARAFVAGHVSGPIEGDTKQQAGAVFVDQDAVVQLYHRAESLGDHVDTRQLVDAAIAACLSANPGLV